MPTDYLKSSDLPPGDTLNRHSLSLFLLEGVNLYPIDNPLLSLQETINKTEVCITNDIMHGITILTTDTREFIPKEIYDLFSKEVAKFTHLNKHNLFLITKESTAINYASNVTISDNYIYLPSSNLPIDSGARQACSHITLALKNVSQNTTATGIETASYCHHKDTSYLCRPHTIIQEKTAVGQDTNMISEALKLARKNSTTNSYFDHNLHFMYMQSKSNENQFLYAYSVIEKIINKHYSKISQNVNFKQLYEKEIPPGLIEKLKIICDLSPLETPPTSDTLNFMTANIKANKKLRNDLSHGKKEKLPTKNQISQLDQVVHKLFTSQIATAPATPPQPHTAKEYVMIEANEYERLLSLSTQNAEATTHRTPDPSDG